jgi:hypothetical protein
MILEAVPVEGTAPEAAMLEGATTGPGVLVASEPTEEVHDDALPETSMDVVVRSPEIQDAEPIRSAPMSEAAVGHTPRVLMQGRKNSRRRTPSRIPLYSY